MKILVISDIHGLSRDLENSNGYAGSTGGGLYVEDRSKSKNRLLAVSEPLLESNNQPDIILILGDLAHQAKDLPARQIWSDVHQIAGELEVSKDRVFGVTGNHDVISRAEKIEEISRADYLTNFEPKHPNSDNSFTESYINEGVAACELDQCNVICVNTCVLHGLGGVDAYKIAQKGHITPVMIDKIEQHIRSSEAQYHLLVMHHHPRRLNEIIDPDYDAMENGSELLEMISQLNRHVLLLHGHKHLVNLEPIRQDNSNSWIFSASSLAAPAYPKMENFFTNQCHLIDLTNCTVDDFKGYIYSWDWNVGKKWSKANKHIMPYKSAFGKIVDVQEIAKKLIDLPVIGFYSASELFDQIPELEYSPPNILSDIEAYLDEREECVTLVFSKGYLEGLTQQEPT